MEDALIKWVRLNPCCYGRWSQRPMVTRSSQDAQAVLILVVMEDGLRGSGALAAKQSNTAS